MTFIRPSRFRRRLTPAYLPLVSGLLVVGACGSTSSAAPTPRQALGLKPIQAGVEYDQPTSDQIDECTIKPEKVNGNTSWVVRDGAGQLLRRFSDTNGDNVVDQWSYFQNGLEVYRDIDSDFNGKADQYRWLNTAGTRWGIDKDENGKIESWKQISPFEVAQVAIEAVQRNDSDLFRTLLPNKAELDALGLGKATYERIAEDIKKAEQEFSKFASAQRAVTKQTQFLDMGASRPAAVPAGMEGSTKDLTLYENVAALVENNGKPEQVYLGAMVQVGNSWRLLGLPQAGEAPATESPFALLAPSTGGPPTIESSNAPTGEMQELLTQLENLDRQTGGDRKEQIRLTQQRAEVLAKLAALSPAGQEREQWQRQLADMLSVSVQTLQYNEAIDELVKLGKQLAQEKASEDLRAHVEFRRLWAEYGKAQMDPKSDYTKVQAAWLESLQSFADKYPRVPDTAEALLQLGMGKEFAGEDEAAIEWYTKLTKSFPATEAGKKAKGAMRRLDSIGKPLALSGNGVGGGKVDLASYRGKVVLIHYWATWCEPCKDDIQKLKKIYAQYARQRFDIIGVNLDSSVGQARQFLAQERLPWKHLYDEGGLDGRLANDMGVMTLPLMLLVDDKGQVINRNLHVAELENELKQVLR